jgi:hypothetical protein
MCACEFPILAQDSQRTAPDFPVANHRTWLLLKLIALACRRTDSSPLTVRCGSVAIGGCPSRAIFGACPFTTIHFCCRYRHLRYILASIWKGHAKSVPNGIAPKWIQSRATAHQSRDTHACVGGRKRI